MPKLLIGVLDDYHNLASKHISELNNDETEITVFNDTIPQTSMDELVDGLKPFQVLVTMRERTLIPKELIDRLPNLKIILTTGMRNLGIDSAYAKEKGIVVAGTPKPALP